ncbi:hypothetical protein Cylst_5775 [Cylindrospermum stagnale PCC 7417]|uniref:Uncharacterized protein n=1 Tax=Cylindrospermum stagnale PCC 7417 TaxID=56107 RepID=K9X6P4_9NOST|nr:hypothetical protein [Cylindrospermum stagnale]AFZ27769.1 hypothetical protein Cylst_5775 [Cylindrospermum stagnale PCC 7417]
MKLNQKLRQRIITGLLVVKVTLTGIEATDRIQQGDSVTETLIWLINQCIPVLQHISHREEEGKEGDGLRPGGSDGLRPAKGDRNSTKE